MKHQKKADDTYPISIRITNNRKSVYMSRGLYAKLSQISKKSFEIKDSTLLIKANQIVDKCTNIILMLSDNEVKNISALDLKAIIEDNRHTKNDFINVLREFYEIKKNARIASVCLY